LATGSKAKKNAKTELHIVFDTNALHNQSASDLVRLDVAQLLAENTKHDDLSLAWFIPDTVRLERRYQTCGIRTERVAFADLQTSPVQDRRPAQVASCEDTRTLSLSPRRFRITG
jgi:hypothetical protein